MKRKLSVGEKCLALLSLIAAGYCVVLLITDRSYADELYASGRIERAVCTTYWTDPVTIVCRSETQTCVLYPETGQMECIQKAQ